MQGFAEIKGKPNLKCYLVIITTCSGGKNRWQDSPSQIKDESILEIIAIM
jgi:hypothetical protein